MYCGDLILAATPGMGWPTASRASGYRADSGLARSQRVRERSARTISALTTLLSMEYGIFGQKRFELKAADFGGRLSVCNHLDDLLGVGSAKRQLRKLLFYPNLFGVPKWFTTLPPSFDHPQMHIGQVS
jgi:hypothetical protein